MEKVAVVFYHLAKHSEDSFFVFASGHSVENWVPRQVQVLKPAVFAKNFKQRPDLDRRDLIPADVQRRDRLDR